MTRRTWSLGLLAAAAVSMSVGGASARQFHAIPLPPLPSGTATIAGVVRTDTGAAAPGATLTLRQGDVERRQYADRSVGTDARGRFVIAGVPDLTLSLTAAMDGVVEAEFGQVRPGYPGTPIRLAAGERLQVEIRLARGSSLSGMAHDPAGKPTGGVAVYAFRLEPLDDTVEILGAGGSATSDATGDWRIDHLPPGTYVVLGYRERPVTLDLPPLIAIGPGQSAVEWGGYFPNAVDADTAQRIELGDRDHRSGITIELTHVPVTTVGGLVRAADGKPVPGVRVALLSGNQLGPLPRAVETDANGRFELTHVRSGEYLLDAFDQRTRLRARAPISSDGRTPRDQPLTLAPAATVTGRVVYERAASPDTPLPSAANIFLAQADNGMVGDIPGVPSLTSSLPEFGFDGVPPGRHTFRVSAGPTWWLKSASVYGRDAVDDPFEIAGSEAVGGVVLTLIDAQTELSGVITGRNGRPSTDRSVVVFPADANRWSRGWERVRTTRPDTHGRYLLRGLPAGDYLVAVGSPELRQRPRSDVLRALRGGAHPIALRHGQPATVNLAVR